MGAVRRGEVKVREALYYSLDCIRVNIQWYKVIMRLIELK